MILYKIFFRRKYYDYINNLITGKKAGPLKLEKYENNNNISKIKKRIITRILSFY